MADKIRVELEIDSQKGMVTLRNFDREMEKAISGAGKSGQAADKAGREFDGLGRKIEGAGRKSESAGAMFTKMAGLLGVGFSVQAVVGWTDKVHQAHATYQRDLNMVSTMLDRNSLGQERYTRLMKEYGSGLDDLSVEFGESTRTLSKGLYDILSASVAPGQAMQVLRTSSEAARAGFTDTAVAVDFITNSLNAYHKSVDQAGSVSDIAFATIAKGKTTFVELASQIGRVAPQAYQAGISLEQLMAMIANITYQGNNTNQAVTAVNQLLVQFQRASAQSVEVWGKITKGTEQAGKAFSTARLRGEELYKTLDVLRGATEQQRSALLQENSAMLAANVLMSGTEHLRGAWAKTNNAVGETQEALTKRLGESEMVAARFDKTVDRLWKNLGEQLAPATDSAKTNLTELIGVINNALENDSWGRFGQLFTRMATGFSQPYNLADAEQQLKRVRSELATYSEMPSWLPDWYTVDSARAKVLRQQIEVLQAYIDKAKEVNNALKSLGSGPIFPGDDTIQGALSILKNVNTDNTKADLEALAKLDKKLADEMAKATLDSFQQRERALDAYVAAYKAAGGDIKKIEGDIATLRHANYQGSVEAALEAERKKSEALGKAALERGRTEEREWKASEQRLDKRTAAEREAALLMAQYTGDSLEEQRLEHEKFIDDWIAKGLERNEAEDLWAAKQVQVAQKTGSIWSTVTDSMRQQWTYTWTDPFSESLNSASDFFDVWVDSLDQSLRRGLSSMMNAVNGWLFDLAGALGSDLLSNLFGDGGGGALSGLLDGLFGKGASSSGGGLAGTIFGGIASSAAWAGIKSLGTEVLTSLGFELGTQAATQAGMQAVAQAAAQVAMETGLSAAGEFAMTTAAQEAALQFGGTYAAGEFAGTGALYGGASQFGYGAAVGGEFAGATGTGGSGMMTGSLAAMMASPAGAMMMAALPGTVGMLFNDQISRLLGREAMTSDKARGNWQGAVAYFDEVGKSLQETGTIAKGVGQDFGFFSEAAEDFWMKWQQLGTYGEYSQAELDKIYNSLDPLTRKFLESGKAVAQCGDNIRELAKDIATTRESMGLGEEATAAYQDRIDALAASYGLSGEEAQNFSDKVWEASQDVWTGAGKIIQAIDAISELAEETVNAAGRIANTSEGFNTLGSSVRGLVDDMRDLATATSSVGTVGIGGAGKGTVGVKHAGGQGRPIHYRHDGWPSLKPNEYMAILEEPEWVIRSQAVNSRTAPALDYINRTGDLPGGGGDTYINVSVDARGTGLNEEKLAALIEERAIQAVFDIQERGGGARPRRLVANT